MWCEILALWKKKSRREESIMTSVEEKYYKLSGDVDKFQLIEQEKWFPQTTESLPDTFRSMCDELNRVKSLLNCMPLSKWHRHTRNQNPAGFVIAEVRKVANPELLTQAWCKFMEILWRFPQLVPSNQTLTSTGEIHVKSNRNWIRKLKILSFCFGLFGS